LRFVVGAVEVEVAEVVAEVEVDVDEGLGESASLGDGAREVPGVVPGVLIALPLPFPRGANNNAGGIPPSFLCSYSYSYPDPNCPPPPNCEPDVIVPGKPDE
jgi:hypothetical protein